MSVTAENLQNFYNQVVWLVLDNEAINTRVHFPEIECTKDSCKFVQRLCSWRPLLNLTAWFLRYGPDVTESWKRGARLYRLPPDVLHELLIGAFIGSEPNPGYWKTPFKGDFGRDPIWTSAHEEIPAP